MPMRIVTIKMPEEIYDALMRHARRRRKSFSQVIREAIGLYLAFNYDPRVIGDPEAIPV